MSSAHCYCEYEAFAPLQNLESEVSKIIFLCHDRKLKRPTVKDKSIPTPINLNRVDKIISSTVGSCCMGTVRIFNIISLHFGERDGTNLLLSIATPGRWQAGPVIVATGR
jgi:hypothetical protein